MLKRIRKLFYGRRLLILQVGADTAKSMKDLQARSGSETTADLLRKSLAVYDLLLQERDRGSQII